LEFVQSMFWGLSKGTAGGAGGMLLDAPFSAGGGMPHLPSDSRGSKTWILPSVRPMANWLGSWGCAATASGYTEELQKMSARVILDHTTKTSKKRICSYSNATSSSQGGCKLSGKIPINCLSYHAKQAAVGAKFNVNEDQQKCDSYWWCKFVEKTVIYKHFDKETKIVVPDIWLKVGIWINLASHLKIWCTKYAQSSIHEAGINQLAITRECCMGDRCWKFSNVPL